MENTSYKTPPGVIDSAMALLKQECEAEYRGQYLAFNKGRKHPCPLPKFAMPSWYSDFQEVLQRDDEKEIKGAMMAVRAGCFSLV